MLKIFIEYLNCHASSKVFTQIISFNIISANKIDERNDIQRAMLQLLRLPLPFLFESISISHQPTIDYPTTSNRLPIIPHLHIRPCRHLLPILRISINMII